jgi:hypothetical protein
VTAKFGVIALETDLYERIRSSELRFAPGDHLDRFLIVHSQCQRPSFPLDLHPDAGRELVDSHVLVENVEENSDRRDASVRQNEAQCGNEPDWYPDAPRRPKWTTRRVTKLTSSFMLVAVTTSSSLPLDNAIHRLHPHGDDTWSQS